MLTDFQGARKIRLLVDVDVANALGVTQDRDVAALLLDASNQLAGSARDHQVNVLIHREQVADLLSSRHL